MNNQLTELYRQAEDYFFSGISKKCLNLNDGAHAYMTALPIANLNLVYVHQKPNALDKTLVESKQFYDQANLDFVVVIPQTFCTPEVEEVLKNNGYLLNDKSVSMAMKLDHLTLNDTTQFDDGTMIHATDDKLNEWMLPLVGAFESTIELCSQYANVHEAALKKRLKLRHFSLYKQGKPITSITLSTHNAIARIDDVGTLPEFQGKGYATRLMIYGLSEAKKLGATYCFLEASLSGFSIYQKLGFEPLFKNNIYSIQRGF